jgi:D-3-phosphoglycerate dehydrogenase
VLVSEHLGRRALELLSASADLTAFDLLSEEEYRKRLADADAVIIRSAHSFRPAHMDLARRVRVVARAGAGVDNVDVEEATRRGVLVVNTPGANAVAAAEHTMGVLLAVMRNVARSDRHVREGGWDRQAFIGRELSGRRLGIVGLGRVGSRVAERARAFGMSVAAYDPYLSPEVMRERGAEPVSELAALLERSDVLTLHTPKTGPRLGREELGRLPAGAVVLNVARGGLIDEDALADLLEADHLYGAGLDVFQTEPPNPQHRLFQHPRVVVTSHLGGSTDEAMERIGERVARSVLEALDGRVPAGAVNLPVTAEGGADAASMADTVLMGRLAGSLMALAGPPGPRVSVEAWGDGAGRRSEMLARAVALGYLEAAGDERCNLVSSLSVAEARGIQVRAGEPGEAEGPEGVRLSGTATDAEVELVRGDTGYRLRRLFGASFDAPLSRHLLVTRHQDRPGIIGAIGTILGEDGVNIATMELGRRAPGAEAVMVMGLDNAVSPGALERIQKLASLRQVLVAAIPLDEAGSEEAGAIA